MSHSQYYRHHSSSVPSISNGQNNSSGQPSGLFQLAEYNQNRSNAVYIPSEVQYHSHNVPRNHLQDNTLTIINSASCEMLLASGNIAYFRLFEENMHLKADIAVQKELVADFKDVDKAAIATRSSGSSLTLSQPSTNTLVIPDPPPPCNQDDYEHVQFWKQPEWNKFTKNQCTKGTTLHKLGFVCYEDGTMASEARLTEMRKCAHELWAQLYHDRQDPASWKGKRQTASKFFSNSMCLKFNEFQYCENDWKIKAFTTIHYPDFVHNKRASGQLVRRISSLHNNVKRKSDINNNTHPKSFKPQPPKKQKTAQQEVIDLDPESEVKIQPLPPVASTSRVPLACNARPCPKPAQLSRPCDGDASSSSLMVHEPSVSVTSPVVITTLEPATLTTEITDTTGGTVVPLVSTTSRSTSCSMLEVQVAPDQTQQSLATHISSSPSHHMPRQNPGNQTVPLVKVMVAPTTQSTERHNESAADNSRRTHASQSANILSNLAIPRPAEDLQVQEVTNAATVSTSRAVTASGSVKKGDKPMKATKSDSAQNLFCIEYLKTHSPTVNEFKLVYDALNKLTIKKFEALSREQKAKRT